MVVRVLVVDDQPAFLRAMVAVVTESPGFVVVDRAGSGEQALEVAAESRPDLVLMDVNLPGIDGMECTRRLLAAGLDVVVLLVSTYDEDDVGEEATECGASGYVAKSAFAPERLAAEWADARSAGEAGRAAETWRIESSADTFT